MLRKFKSWKWVTLIGVMTVLLASFQNCSDEHIAGVTPGASTNAFDPVAFAALERKALAVFVTRCASCHTGQPGGALPMLSDPVALRNANYIRAGSPQTSPLYLLLIDGLEPRGGPNMVEKHILELFTIRDWIEMMP